jgi:hypothetical protein
MITSKRLNTFLQDHIALVYYLSPGEDRAGVLASINDSYRNITFYMKEKVYGAYHAWDWQLYEKGTLILNGREVMDAQHRRIAFEELDMDSNSPKRTIKKYYLKDLGPF